MKQKARQKYNKSMKQKAVFPRKSIKIIASKQTAQEKKQITSTRNENSNMISDSTDIKRVIRNINNSVIINSIT